MLLWLEHRRSPRKKMLIFTITSPLESLELVTFHDFSQFLMVGKWVQDDFGMAFNCVLRCGNQLGEEVFSRLFQEAEAQGG